MRRLMKRNVEAVCKVCKQFSETGNGHLLLCECIGFRIMKSIAELLRLMCPHCWAKNGLDDVIAPYQKTLLDGSITGNLFAANCFSIEKTAGWKC